MNRMIFALVLLGLMGGPLRADDRAGEEFFEARIRPLFIESCQSCHGEDDPKGGLSMMSREAILNGGHGGPAAEPGKPDESYLMEVLQYDSEPRMPPKGKLTDAEIDAVSEWIARGMPWPGAPERMSEEASSTGSILDRAVDHWAFQPVSSVSPPEVIDEDRVKTPIDRFIIKRLEGDGLTLSPEADRRTLIRRLTIALTGLPATREEVEAFVGDESSDAYDRLVDRLIDSNRFGEQWARHWLDVARYSDTKGYVYAREEAEWVHAPAYRDWVVSSINDDLPYDRFLMLQLAADFEADDPKDLAAMGFLTLGRRFLGVGHDIIDDRIDVVTRGMLGLTVSCARCHDHKYDPIPTADYYGLYGVFRNCAEELVPAFESDGAETKGTPAFWEGLREREQAYQARLETERRLAADRVRARVTEYLLAQFRLGDFPEASFNQILSDRDMIPESVHRWKQAIDRAGRDGDPIWRIWHAFMAIPEAAFAEEAVEVTRLLAGEEVNSIIARAFVEPPLNREDVAKRYGTQFRGVIETWERLCSEASEQGIAPPARLDGDDEEAIRQILYGPDAPAEVPDEAFVNIEYFFPTPTTVELWQLQGEIDRWIIRSPGAPTYALILQDRRSLIEPRIFRRGNPSSPGEVVPRGFLQAISDSGDSHFREGSGRHELARAIVNPSNPLTARVAVNRAWMLLFGEGLVKSAGDFGTRADAPSHPELLDWLATRFQEEGWSLKWLVGEMVRSSTYRQSARGPVDPLAFERARMVDPENRQLWRMPVHRLSFEEMRDSLLLISGDLDDRMGGRAEPMFTPPYSTRRTLYGKVDREDLPSVLRVFDFANPDLLIPKRGETTVPQQALFFLNHPFLIDRAKGLIARPEINEATSDEERVRVLFRLVSQREPSADEVVAALALVRNVEEEISEGETRSGSSDWRYGFGRFDEESGEVEGFTPLPYFSETAWQGGPAWPDGTLGWLRLDAEGGHPGNDRNHAVVRRWVAPRDARVKIQSTLIHDPIEGDGVRGFLCGSGFGTIASATVHHGQQGFSVEDLQVVKGDVIDFVVDVGDSLNSDQFLWSPTIVEVGTVDPFAWDARRDFEGDGAGRLAPWEQLAQVLLMTNELMFVE